MLFRSALLRERDWIKPRDIPEADLKKASESVAKIADLLATDPEGISTQVNRLVKGLEKLSKDFEALSENAWADVVRDKQPSVEEAVLKQAEQHDSAAETVRRIRSINKELNSKAPLDLDELHAIANRWEELKRLIAQLPTATDNPDVKRFLNAIRGGGGAPLSYLTDSVREYLTDEGLVESYHIYKKR